MKKYIHEIWIIIAVSIILILSAISKTEILKVIASVSGVIYVLGIAKEKRTSQLFGLVNTGVYAYLMIKDKVYGSAAYNGLYCLPMLVYTYFNWGKKGEKKLKISRYTVIERCKIIIGAISIITLYFVIATKIGVNYALVDAITITCGAFGMYAISKKKIEQWYAFILVNIANMIMWLSESIINPANIIMAITFVIYMINNIYGFLVWKKEIKKSV